MVAELDDADTSLDIPQHAGHVTRRGNDLAVVDESTAAEVTRVSTQFTGTPGGGSRILLVQAVDRANVIKTSASNKVARW